MIAHVVRWELRSLLRDRATWAVLVLFVGVAAYAGWIGASSTASEGRALAVARAEEAARFAALEGELAQIAAGGPVRHASDPRSPLLVGRSLGARAATLPHTPLAAVSIGQRDVLPHVVLVSTDARVAEASAGAGSSPTRLMTGAFDLAFVLVFLLPLVVIALGYDLLAGERERGTLGLVLSQPISVATFVMGKALSRGALLVGLLLVLGVVALPLGGAVGGEGAPLRTGLLVALLLLYVGFWFGAALYVNAVGRTAAGNALALIGLWLALVVVVPGLASVAVDTIHPAPSRVELVHLAREAAEDAEEAVVALEGDHGDDPARRAARSGTRALEVQETYQRTVAPVLAAFHDQLARQQGLVDGLRFVSPSIVLHEGLSDVAGSSVRRHQHFMRQVDALQEEQRRFFGERVRRGVALDASDYAAMPRFDFRDEAPGALAQRIGAGLLGLLGPTLLLIGLAVARFRRPIVVEPR